MKSTRPFISDRSIGDPGAYGSASRSIRRVRGPLPHWNGENSGASAKTPVNMPRLCTARSMVAHRQPSAATARSGRGNRLWIVRTRAVQATVIAAKGMKTIVKRLGIRKLEKNGRRAASDAGASGWNSPADRASSSSAVSASDNPSQWSCA